MFPSLKSCMLHFWQAQADDWHEKETELAGDRPVLLRVTLILHYIMMWRAWARLCVNITGRKHCFQNPHPCFAWMEGSARTGGGSEWMNNPETRAKKHEGLTERDASEKEHTEEGALSSTRSPLSLSPTPQTSRPSSAPQQNRQLWNYTVLAGFASLVAHPPFHLYCCWPLLSLPTTLFSPLTSWWKR